MSVKGFVINGSGQKYNYPDLDNKPSTPGGGGGVSDDLKAALLLIAEKVAYADNGGQAYYQALYDALYSEPTYSVTNNLTSVTNSNVATRVTQESAYTATLTAASGYTINSVQITMGGSDITAAAYSNGTISIASVTGNLVITAIATQRTATLTSISAVFTQGQNVIYDTDSLDTLEQYLVVTALWSDTTTSTVPSTDYTLSGTLAEGTSTITVSYGGKTDTFTVTVSTFDTSPVIEEENKTWTSSYSTSNKTGAGITTDYEMTIDVAALKASSDYDSTNDYMNSGGSLFNIAFLSPNSAGISSWSTGGKGIIRDSSDNGLTWATSANQNSETTWGSGRQNSELLNAETIKLSMTITLADAEDSYAYHKQTTKGHVMPIGVSVGDVIYAGENTPYYGCRNIADAPALSSISAVFTQGETVVTPNTSLDSLKEMLVVTASYANGRTHTVNKNVYVLSGTLAEGTSTITVTYNDKTASFSVVVTAA